MSIYGDTAVTGDSYDGNWSSNRRSGYVYTIIDGKWTKNINIVLEDSTEYE